MKKKKKNHNSRRIKTIFLENFALTTAIYTCNLYACNCLSHSDAARPAPEQEKIKRRAARDGKKKGLRPVSGRPMRCGVLLHAHIQQCVPFHDARHVMPRSFASAAGALQLSHGSEQSEECCSDCGRAGLIDRVENRASWVTLLFSWGSVIFRIGKVIDNLVGAAGKLKFLLNRRKKCIFKCVTCIFLNMHFNSTPLSFFLFFFNVNEDFLLRYGCNKRYKEWSVASFACKQILLAILI